MFIVFLTQLLFFTRRFARAKTGVTIKHLRTFRAATESSTSEKKTRSLEIVLFIRSRVIMGIGGHWVDPALSLTRSLRHIVTSHDVTGNSRWFSVPNAGFQSQTLVLFPNAGSLSKNWFSVRMLTFFEWTSCYQTLLFSPKRWFSVQTLVLCPKLRVSKCNCS